MGMGIEKRSIIGKLDLLLEYYKAFSEPYRSHSSKVKTDIVIR
jgi:hypothetical protein